MVKPLTVFHGSHSIVGKPRYGAGGIHHDFGPGFYCTASKDLAWEWACRTPSGGFVCTYELDLKGLKVLNIGRAEFGLMKWLAILARFRTFCIDNEMLESVSGFLSSSYGSDAESYDVIRGPRGDDSYFSFATDFLANTSSFGKLSGSMSKCGEQIAIVSERAFSALSYVGSEPVDSERCFRDRCERDLRARQVYLERGRREGIDSGDVMMEDLILGRVSPYDTRLQ